MQAQSYAADVFNTPVKKKHHISNTESSTAVGLLTRGRRGFNSTVRATVRFIAVKYGSRSRGDPFVRRRVSHQYSEDPSVCDSNSVIAWPK